MNTLKYYDSLIAAGNTEAQARAHIAATESALGDLVTKDDLKNAIEMLNVKITTQFNVIERVGGSFCIGVFLLLLKIAIWG